MPELPEVQALAAFLVDNAAGHFVTRTELVAFGALKTYDPPLAALSGLQVSGAARYGKFLDIQVGGDVQVGGDPAARTDDGALHLVTHLARAGWLHWRQSLPPAPMRPGGKNPVALRVRLDDDSGFDLTEAGTKKGLAIYVVRSVLDVPGVARLGIDALDPALTPERLGSLLADVRQQIKGALTSQQLIAGIGNAYSDEILHAARLSPFAIAAKLTSEQVEQLHAAMVSTLRAAVDRSVGQRAATLKAEKRSGLAVHARTGLPCPVCGDLVREVSFADKSMQYCPTCQTGGKPLADRRLSKLLR